MDLYRIEKKIECQRQIDFHSIGAQVYKRAAWRPWQNMPDYPRGRARL